MSKRIICVLCAALLSLVWVTTAFAAASTPATPLAYCPGHTFIRQYQADYVYLPRGKGHSLARQYVDICSYCGFSTPLQYEYVSEVLSHVNGGKDNFHYSSTDTHAFYLICKYCNKHYAEVKLDCDYDTTGIHVKYSY